MAGKRHYAKGINPELLRWYRENVRYSILDVATHLKVNQDNIKDWESGNSLPTIRQAMELGKFYRKPWAVFFLSEKPNFQILQDFRTVSQKEKGLYSPRLSIFLDDIRGQQEWLRDYLKVYLGEENSYTGSWFNLNKPKDLAEKIVEVLKIDYEKVFISPKRFSVLKYYQALVEENAGIFVGKTTAERISVDEMRGVFLQDKYAPMIFINSTDAMSAQIFTLFHEVAHAFVGKEGVSNVEPLKFSGLRGIDNIEVFCNKVASEVVLPERLLVESFDGSFENIFVRIKNVSLSFKVSEEMIAIKLFSLGKINSEELREVKRKTREAVENKQVADFGNYHLNRFSRNGILFTQTVLSAYKAGEIMTLEAAKILNIKTAHINQQMNYAFK